MTIVYRKRGEKMHYLFVSKVMEKKRQQVMSTRDPQMSGNFELKGAEGGVQLPYSGKDITH